MDSINIAVASQGFVIALFPIYGDMKREARPKVMISIFGALTFTFSVYTVLSIVSIQYFGIDNIKQSIFENMQHSRDISTLSLLGLFLTIFCCNIPFVFFAGKLSFISIVQMFLPRPPDIDENEEFNMNFLGNQDNFTAEIMKKERFENTPKPTNESDEFPVPKEKSTTPKFTNERMPKHKSAVVGTHLCKEDTEDFNI